MKNGSGRRDYFARGRCCSRSRYWGRSRSGSRFCGSAWAASRRGKNSSYEYCAKHTTEKKEPDATGHWIVTCPGFRPNRSTFRVPGCSTFNERATQKYSVVSACGFSFPPIARL